MTSSPDIVARVRSLMAEATGTDFGVDDQSRPLPWEVWTSCSFRRVKTAGIDGAADVLSAYRSSDGCLDLSMPEDRLIALVEAINALPALLAHIDAAEAALRNVRQELWVDYCLHMGTSQPDSHSKHRFDTRPHIRIIDAALSHTTNEGDGNAD